MQTNMNPSGSTQPSNLLATIYKVEVRNEQKISAADREFYERQQAVLYETLEQIERCYAVLRAEAEHYNDFFKITCEPNGRIAACAQYPASDGIPTDYRIAAFKLFDSIETFVKLNYEVNEIFAARIVRYFNETYHVSIPEPTLDAKTLDIGFRPVYMTYVDRVIEHLGGRSFRTTAETEILERFLNHVRPGRWAKSKPELKGCKITFPDIVTYDSFYFKWHHCHRMASGIASRLDTFCEGIMLGAEERIDGSLGMIAGLDTDDVDPTRWYDMATESGVQFQFFKNGRIDVKFKDAAAAETCFQRLRLHELRHHNDTTDYAPTMYYPIIPQHIPQERRAEVSEKILFAIDSGGDAVPPESVYNCYTGIGGLHGLRQSDYGSYHDYAEAKKEAEIGQFFTPHEVCRQMVELLAPTTSEMVLDMCCGMGNFFNHLPNLHNTYGFDVDPKAVAVARYLYPDAHIETCDIRQYNPGQRFDIIVGNPPFNLRFDYRLSQEYYMDKAYSVLNPAGLLMLVVPCSFLQSEFWEKSRIAGVNEHFSFVGQTCLPENAFAGVGVERFATKVMVFLRASEHIGMKAYRDNDFVSTEVLHTRIAEAREMKRPQRLYLLRETASIDKEELEVFEYRLAKYLYELKAHARLQEHLPKAEALVAKFRNQRPPENCTNEEYKKWEKNKLTTAKVLATIRRYISRQHVVPRKEVALVKTSYGFKLKAYAPRLLDKVEHREASIVDLVSGQVELPVPPAVPDVNIRQIRAAKRLIARKRRQYERQEQPFEKMTPDPALAEHLDRTTFVNKEYEICRFTELQKLDLNRVMQKRYALLNWQQGSCKTAAVYHRAKYLLKYGKVRNAIILAPAIAVNMMWCPFLDINGERYRQVRCPADLDDVPAGVFLVVSTSLLAKLQRSLIRFVKLRSRKLALVFDESDEITNPLSARTRYVLCIFRRLKYKILDTGTTTRNNIGELYSQFELLYNNSANMICWSSECYHENKDREIECEVNPYYGQTFPALRGHVLFKSCHCPGKASVFGIEKQNQDVYNKDSLADLIAKTVITRKFKDFAGEKYEVKMHAVKPSAGEQEVYRVIIEEFCRICELYYNSTGDTRKDAGLRLMRQIKLLIKACSVPHLIDGYYGDEYPSKVRRIDRLVRSIPGKVAIGCTSLAAFDLYESYMRQAFPERPLFTVKGDVPFERRQRIVAQFDATLNGILVSTQQSLSSSVNIPSCNDVILESLQWNLPRMEQYYFRFIRLDSKEKKNVHFITYEDSVEQNLMALVLTKERLNEFIKTGEVKEQSEIFEEFDVTMSVIESLLKREMDRDGKIHITWGSQRIAS